MTRKSYRCFLYYSRPFFPTLLQCRIVEKEMNIYNYFVDFLAGAFFLAGVFFFAVVFFFVVAFFLVGFVSASIIAKISSSFIAAPSVPLGSLIDFLFHLINGHRLHFITTHGFSLYSNSTKILSLSL